MKNTKIVCTIGPASEKVLKRMVDAGMDAVRINTAHGEFGQYEDIIKALRKIADIPVIFDIKGPELRIRVSDEIMVRKGMRLEVGFSKKHSAYFNASCYRDIKVGDKVLIQDGLLESEVVKKAGKAVILEFRNIRAMMLRDRKNVTVLDRRLNIPPLSARDKEAIKFAMKNDVEYIALSYTRDARDVQRVRDLLGKSGIGIICKIENPEGIKNIESILRHADGIMVARGSMGVELPLQRVPLVQKDIIGRCIQAGKLVITATQMLESMIENPRPTRAEASDVANAILDGSDAVMLSAETAIGKYPVRAVRVMADIAREAEKHVKGRLTKKCTRNLSDAITRSVNELCRTIRVDKILTLTKSGYTARMMSRFRADKGIIAVTPDPLVKRQLGLCYGVQPVLYKAPKHEMTLHAAAHCFRLGLLEKEDTVVFAGGLYTTQSKTSNMIHVNKVSDIIKYGRKRL